MVRLGVITGAHGIRGQVKIRSFTASPEDITSYGTLSDKAGTPYRISAASHSNDILIATVEGVSTRNDAEKLRNVELFIPRDALPATEANEYYHEDLIGMEVITADGTPYGHVKSVNNFGAGDLLEIRLASGAEEFFPFSRAIFPAVDLQAGKITISPPENVE